MRKTLLTVVLSGLLAAPALADRAQFQIGYVLDSWTSNFVYSGSEQRIPASFSFSSGDFGLSADTAFVVGDYEQSSAGGLAPASYKSNQISDGTMGASLNLGMGPSLISTVAGTLNVGTGDTTWEGRSSIGAIPFLFEPSYYHGRGWGGNLFWTLNSTGEAFNWSAGAGYLLTTTYDIGLPGQSSFNPGDSLLVMGSMGGSLSS